MELGETKAARLWLMSEGWNYEGLAAWKRVCGREAWLVCACVRIIRYCGHDFSGTSLWLLSVLLAACVSCVPVIWWCEYYCRQSLCQLRTCNARGLWPWTAVLWAFYSWKQSGLCPIPGLCRDSPFVPAGRVQQSADLLKPLVLSCGRAKQTVKGL